MAAYSITDTTNDDSLGLTSERFGFTMFVSVCLHAVLILGVGFTLYEQYETNTTSLDITLAQYRSNEAPENADFLAQANQQGSGNLDEAAAPSTPVQSRFNDDEIRDVSPFVQQQQANSAPANQEQILARVSDNASLNNQEESSEVALQNEQGLENLSETEFSDSIASLQAQLDLHRQAYAKRPRRYTISSASTREDRDALYMDNWRKKIEAVGNLNYPQQASANSLYGTLRVLVALRPDGSVNEIKIMRSSGYPILDSAVIRIVQLAAPFEPFPDGMSQDVDILEIIRTWQFHQGDTFSSF